MLHLFKSNDTITRRSACLLLAGLTMARGTSFLMSKQLLGVMPPLCLLGLRFLLAFAVLFLLFFRSIREEFHRDPALLPAAAVLGAVYFLCMASELIGLQYTTASACSFLENSAVVIVPILEALLLRRLPGPVIILSTLVTFSGIGLLVLRGSAGGSGPLIGPGELLCLLAALLYAAAIILTDRFSKKHNPLVLGVLYVGVMGALGMTASFCVETPVLPRTGGQWTALLALALLCTAFGFAAQPVAQKPLTPETTGILCALNPLTTAVLGWLLLQDALGIRGILGAVLILVGILLPHLARRRFGRAAARCEVFRT